MALGIPAARDRDDELTKARAALNWQKHFDLSFDPDFARALHDEDLDVDTDFCAMCGHDWCSVRISKEIQEFTSGKDAQYAWDKPKISEALTAEQQEVLRQRGVLSPEEVHALAAKTKKAVGATPRADSSPNRAAHDVQALPLAGDGEARRLSCHSDYVDAETAERIQRERLVLIDTSQAHNIGKHDSVI